jgi:hypothetical protein
MKNENVAFQRFRKGVEVAFESLVLLLHIQEVSDSCPSPQTRYPEIFRFSSVPSGKCMVSTSE